MFRNRNRWLGLWSAVCRAPDDLQGFAPFGGGAGEGGSGGGGGGGFGMGDNESIQSPLIGQESPEAEDPLKDVLAAFADDADDDDTGGTPDPNAGAIPQEQITAMQQSVQTAIANMRVPDDMIPDDFNGNDPQALRGLMNKVMQHTISQSLNVVFQPVQLAMRQMAQTMTAQIDSRVNESKNGMKDENIIESMVPEINMPEYSGLVKQMDTALKAKGKTAKERGPLLRKMLNQMGIQNNSGNGGNGGNQRRTANPGGVNTPTIRTGHAALDSFFGALPVATPAPKK